VRRGLSQRLLGGAVTALLLLLVLLATLQYRWIGRLSEIEEERMRANVELASRRFASDFNTEMTRAFSHFQGGVLRSGGWERGLFGRGEVDPERRAENLQRGAIRLFDQWLELASYPELFADLIWLPEGEAGSVFRYAEGQEGFLQIDEEIAVDLTPTPGASERPPFPYSAAAEGLVIFLFGPDDRPGPGRREHLPRRLEGDEPSALLLLRLDRAVLVDEVFPQLGETHFGVAEGASLDFAVIGRGDSEGEVEVFASSGEIDPRSWTEPDSAQPLFAWHTSQMGRSMRQGVTDFVRRSRGGRGGHMPPGHRGGPEPGRPNPGRPDSGDSGFADVVGPIGELDPARLDEAPWRLVVRHQEGSLSAAVSSIRRRNLAASTGILLLLGAAAAVLFAASRRAQHLAQLQVDFVAGVSHELRTPVAAVRSLGENLADGIVDSGDQVQRYGEQITRQSDRLGELVEQVLQFAGGMSERLEERRPLHVRAAVDGAVSDCAALTSAQEGSVVIESTADSVTVLGNRTAVRGAVRNLISNALKYGGARPEVRIRLETEGESVAIRVADSGPGIDPSEEGRLFEPFYRSESAREAQVEGTGLGLSLVREVAESHRGTVELEPTEAAGSCFKIMLPIHGRDEGAVAGGPEGSRS